MDMRYQEYCLADSHFYDSPNRWNRQETGFSEAAAPVPDGWVKHEKNPWTSFAPQGAVLPAQGWKIHVSACADEAADVLSIVWRYCVAGNVPFKFLPSKGMLIARNLKYSERGGSGKFITIYPEDESALEEILTGLGRELAGRRGPYVLSDLRWGDGPLYVRYGGFVERYCRNEQGELVLAIEDPDGELVPDSRLPVFQPPEWIVLPEFLREQRDALGGIEPPAGFPYRIEQALHFSNGGGIYLAEDTRDGGRVVLKEARPYAGLDPRGVDAVARLQRERDFLTDLTDVDQVVDVYDHFMLWEHHFMAQEYVEGQTLNKAILERYPLVRAETTAQKVTEYTEWALDLVGQVEAGLALLHGKGITFGDLHPNNIMVRPDGRIAFIDFEMAYRDGEPPNVGVGAPGYVPPDGRSGTAADLFALACLKVSVFLPLTMLFPLDPGKAELLVSAIVERFPVPPDFGDRILSELRLETGPEHRMAARLISDWGSATPDWQSLGDSLASAILASATPARSDRLFPGDIQQFLTNGLGLAHGAAGVLYALSATGHGRHPQYEDWLIRAVKSGGTRQQIGFYDGLHGIAYALDHIGDPVTARELLDGALRAPLDKLPSDLFSGLAGIGLNLLHFGEHDLALRSAQILADRLTATPLPEIRDVGSAITATGKAGLMRGTSGQALLFLRLFERTGDSNLLDLAERALAHDVRYLLPIEDDGSLQLNEGWRVLPYLASGSAGVGLIIQESLRYRRNEELAGKLDQIRRAAEPEFIITSTLFNGRAGLIAFLSRLRDSYPGDERLEALIERHLRRLAWHAIGYAGELAFPGEQLLRLSMDLGSGGAGVLLALHAALGHGPALPFLEHPSQVLEPSH